MCNKAPPTLLALLTSSRDELSPEAYIIGVEDSLPWVAVRGRGVSAGELGLGAWSPARLARRFSSLRRSSIVCMVNLTKINNLISENIEWF